MMSFGRASVPPRRNRTVSRRDFLKGALAIGMVALTSSRSDIARAATLRAQPAQITFWHSFGGNLLTAIESMVDQFNTEPEHADIVVTASLPATSYAGLVSVLSAAYEAGKSPDLIQTAFPIALARHGYLEPLDVLARRAGVPLTDFISVLTADTVIDGATYALPNARSVPVMYANTTLLSATGLEASTLLSTWSNLLQHGQQFRQATGGATSGAGSLAAFGCPPFFWFWTQMTWAFGGEIASSDGTVLFNQGPAVDALKFWQDLVHRHGVAETYPNGTGFASWGATSVAWYNEHIATMALSTAQFPQTLAQIPPRDPEKAADSPPRFAASLAPMPGEGERPRAVPVGGANLALSARSPHKEAAFQFMAWLTAPEQARAWHEASGYLPSRTSALSLPAIQQLHAEKPDYRVAPDQLPIAKRLPVLTEAPSIEPEINRMLEAVVLNRADVQTSVDTTARVVTDLWQRYLADKPA
jgi:sn-glycerol 3-phosphate transport system substrate-binding protein